MRTLGRSAALAAVLGIWVAATAPASHAQDEADGTDGLRELIATQQASFALEDESDPAPADAAPLFSADEIDALVAPVALYPDALLAQVLVAATYPLQIVKAGRLLEASEGMSDDALTRAIAEADLDPSVLVLLSGFPTVVARMADDLDWTEQLGNAMLAQDEEVLAAVQRLRSDAVAAGTLESNEAQVVETRDDAIAIRPADPEVVYVPSYEPAMAFAPAAAPYQTRLRNPLGDPLTAGALAFGAALLVQELFGDEDDDADNDGWDDYWTASRPIDWRRREVYARPRHAAYQQPGAWSVERDRYWDRDDRRWRRDVSRSRALEAERRAAIRWIDRDRETRAARVKALRERDAARAAERREEKRKAEAKSRAKKANAEATQARRQAKAEAKFVKARKPEAEVRAAAKLKAAKKKETKAAERPKKKAKARKARREEQATARNARAETAKAKKKAATPPSKAKAKKPRREEKAATRSTRAEPAKAKAKKKAATRAAKPDRARRPEKVAARGAKAEPARAKKAARPKQAKKKDRPKQAARNACKGARDKASCARRN